MEKKYSFSETKLNKLISNVIEKIVKKSPNLINESNGNVLIEKYIKEEIKNAYNSVNLLYEGIKYDTYTREVEYSDSEDSVNTSIEDNPTMDETEIYPNVNVWSIFQRKDTPGVDFLDNKDGNPLLYAFKNEEGWHFKNEKDRRKFIYLFEQIAKKFLQQCKADVTVVIPTGGGINNMIANTIKRQRQDTNIVHDLLRKLTVEEVWDTIDNLNSPFRKMFGQTREDWKSTKDDLELAFKKMKKYRDGNFTYHFLPYNKPYRDYITQSLACDEWSRGKYAKDIYQHDILIIDDSISRGKTIANACDILSSFEPKSITALTMFSKKK